MDHKPRQLADAETAPNRTAHAATLQIQTLIVIKATVSLFVIEIFRLVS